MIILTYSPCFFWKCCGWNFVKSDVESTSEISIRQCVRRSWNECFDEFKWIHKLSLDIDPRPLKYWNAFHIIMWCHVWRNAFHLIMFGLCDVFPAIFLWLYESWHYIIIWLYEIVERKLKPMIALPQCVEATHLPQSIQRSDWSFRHWRQYTRWLRVSREPQNGV